MADAEAAWLIELSGLVLRTGILFCVDALTSSLPLCAFASRLGYAKTFHGMSYESDNGTNSTVEQFVLPGYVSTFQALFSWNSPCCELWDFLSTQVYIVFTFFYAACLALLLSVLVLDSRRLLRLSLWSLGSLFAVVNVAWSLDLREAAELPDSQREWLRLLPSFMSRAAWVSFAGGAYVELRGRSHPEELSNPLLRALLRLSFAGPLLMRFAPLALPDAHRGLMSRLPLSLLLPLFLFESAGFFLRSLPKTLLLCYAAVVRTRQSARDFGIHAVALHHWQRLQTGTLMRCFWITRVSALLLCLVVEHWVQESPRAEMSGSGPTRFGEAPWADVLAGLEYILARGCETFVALVGMTSAVATLGHAAGEIVRWLLHGNLDADNGGEEEAGAGGHLGLLFVILAVQTGLTELRPEKRLLKLYRNLSLLSMALLHFAHAQTESVLGRLTSLGLFRRSAHVRALFVSSLLLGLPWIYIAASWATLWDPWVLSVVVFAAEVILKMAISLMVYGLLLLDTHRGPIRRLDDAVYAVRSFGASLELACAVILLLDGVYILIFEQTGALRSLMIGIHAYCNIYLQAKQGWESFSRRWHSARKLDELRTLTPAQLAAREDDVCSICYQELGASAEEAVKETRCRHAFHLPCLRKWLLQQDSCPMCHAKVLNPEPDPPGDSAEAGEWVPAAADL